jgi:hypothetical protein
MKNRRIEKRVPLIHHLRIFRQKSDLAFGFLVNITTRGLMLFSPQAVVANIGTLFPLEMALPETVLGAKAIAFQAENRWGKRDELTGMYAIGFRIAEIDSQNAKVLRAAMARYRSRA